MTEKKVEFVLQDQKGISHKYELFLHPASQGKKLVFKLVALLSGPLMSFFSEEKKKGKSDESRAVQALSQSLLAPEMDELVTELVSKAVRDMLPPSKEDFFDDAFTGNYGELGSLLGKVIEHNGFLGLLSISMTNVKEAATQAKRK